MGVRSLSRSRARRNGFRALVPLAVVVSFAVAGPIGLAGATTRNGASPAVPASCTNTNAITLGDPASTGSITAPAQVDCYTFSGIVGDRIHITVTVTDGTLVASTEIDDPSDTTLCGPTTDSEQTCQLATSGTHTIVIQDDNGTDTGGYTVAAVALHAACTTTGPITLTGGVTSGSITAEGQADCYTFNGIVGDRIRITVNETSGTLVANTSVIDPGDTVVCGPTTDSQQTCELATSGTHTILIRDSASTNTGTYTVSALALHPACTNTGPITVGDPATAGSITAEGQADCYTFSGIAGDRIQITVAETSGALLAKMSLINPADSVSCGPTTASDLVCTLATSGSYTILIRDNAATNTGDYTVGAVELHAACSTTTPITLGAAAANGSITAEGQSNCYTFNGSTGDRVHVTVVETSGSLEANTSIIDPADAVVCGPTTDSEQICTLASTGTYRILIRDSAATNTGDYTVAAEKLAPPCTNTFAITLGDPASSGTINDAGQADCYTFDGIAGDRIHITVAETSGTLVAEASLTDPTNTTTCAATTDSEQVCTLATSGTQTIMIRDSAGTNTGDYTVAAEQLSTTCADLPATPIAFGAAPLSGSISLAGDSDCYVFRGKAGLRVRIVVVETGGTLNANTDVLDHNGAQYCGPSTDTEMTCRDTLQGFHTIKISDVAGTGTGTYNIYVQRLALPQGCQEITFGEAVTSSIAVAADADCYTFKASSGRKVRLRVVETSGTLQANTEILNPNGTTLCSSTEIEQTCRIVTHGTQTILLRDLSGANTGAYTLYAQLSRTAGCGHLKFGKTALSGSITLAGNADCYRFDAASFDRVRLRVFTTGGTLEANADIMNPNGTTACGPSTALEQTCKLVGGTGTYTVMVRDLVGPHTGTYSIYLQRLNSPLLCVPILFGDPAVAGSITVPADADCYTFDSTWQQVFQVEVIATAGTLQPNTEVLSPNGSTLCGPATDDVLTCKSAATGSHSVLIRDLVGGGTGTYTISVRQI